MNDPSFRRIVALLVSNAEAGDTGFPFGAIGAHSGSLYKSLVMPGADWKECFLSTICFLLAGQLLDLKVLHFHATGKKSSAAVGGLAAVGVHYSDRSLA